MLAGIDGFATGNKVKAPGNLSLCHAASGRACTRAATCVSSHDVGFACPRQLGGLFLFEVMTMYVWILVSVVIGIMVCVWLDVRPMPLVG